MNRIELHGDLARFGTGFNMDVGSPLEAFHALDMQLPGFRQPFIDGEYVAVREDEFGKFLCDEEMVCFNMYGTTIHFVPLIGGSGHGKGAIKTILGVALFVGSMFIAPGASFLGISHIAGLGLKGAGMLLGATLALGGASLLLAPQLKMSDTTKNDQSFLFGGDPKSDGQDFLVPVTYGKDRVKPHVVSSQIITNQIGVGYGGTYDGTTPYTDQYVRDPTYDYTGANYGF